MILLGLYFSLFNYFFLIALRKQVLRYCTIFEVFVNFQVKSLHQIFAYGRIEPYAKLFKLLSHFFRVGIFIKKVNSYVFGGVAKGFNQLGAIPTTINDLLLRHNGISCSQRNNIVIQLHNAVKTMFFLCFAEYRVYGIDFYFKIKPFL